MSIHTAGEALPRDLADELLSRGARLHNLYGPTETTIYATAARVLPGERITIGAPLDNTQTYVLDENLEPTPIGVVGQLFIAGVMVARGYLGRQELTAEKFVPDPFTGRPGARMYATGDLATWLPDGTLDYLGRNDHQVKLRGYRIELGEIETTLRAANGVQASVVVAREDVPGDKRLVAYVVPRSVDVDALKTTLRAALPEYMVPSAFVLLDALPQTGTGKVDRNALPAPDFSAAAAAFAAPRNALETTLAALWSEILGLERVGIHDDFFALGGHSLLATRVMSRLRDSMGIQAPLRALFEAPTVARMAERLGSSPARAALASIPRAPRDGSLVASFAQERLWFLSQLDPGAATYNVQIVLRLRGALQAPCLASSLVELVMRHEVLRTTFEEVDGQPRQVIHASAAVTLDIESVTEEAALRARVRQELARPFDIERGPMLRARLFRLTPAEHVLVIVTHHIATDGWSTDLVLRELSAMYGARLRGGVAQLAALPIQYADFAIWQRDWLRGEVLETQLAYWKAHLDGAPASLELPTDRPRPPVKRHRGGRVHVALPDGMAASVREVARAEDVTPFMVLLGAFDVMLARHAGQDDVVVGTPIANRTRSELEGLVGFFVNTLAVRTKLDGRPTFREVIQRVRRAALGAYDHQDVPFERLVEELHPPRDTSRSPIFQVMFVHQSVSDSPVTFDGLEVSREPSELEASKFDLTLTVEEHGSELAASVAYDSDLFERSTAERIAERYGVLLAAALARPETRIADLPMMSATERQRIVRAGHADGVSSPHHTMLEAFEATCRRVPSAIAITAGQRTLSYAELDARANALAVTLVEAGVLAGDLVGVVSTPCIELAVAIFGVWKAAAAYVPLDPSLPRARLRDLAREVRVIAAPKGVTLDADRPLVPITEESREKGPARSLSPSSAAYVLFTSGSTGTPKGVVVEHGNLSSYVRGVIAHLDLQAGSYALVSTFSADLGNTVLFPPFVLGGTLHVLDEETRRDGTRFRRYMEEHRIDVLKIVPSHFVALTEALGGFPRKRLVFGGEAANIEDVRAVLAARPESCRVFNHYGPTETTVGVLTFDMEAGLSGESNVVPLGRPLPDCRVYVLDTQGQPVPTGVFGELFIGGPQVARAYLGDAAKTADRFVADPFSSRSGARMYRTGDRARWLASGNVEFAGRLDDQIKVRGFRVELSEIAAVLRASVGVREAIVLPVPAASGVALVAYVVGEGLEPKALRDAARSRLPEYMVPASILVLDALPLTANGKIDRKRLPVPEASASPHVFEAPRTELERAIATVFQDVIGAPQVGLHDDFFALGGHSLLATRAASRLRAALGADVPVGLLFEAPTVAALAERLASARSGVRGTQIERAVRGGPLPASFAQERLWFLAQLDPDSPTYHVPMVLRLRGALDVEAVASAISALVARHEVLRTTFANVDGHPLQVIHPPADVPFGVEDALHDEDARSRVRAELERPFDLERGPLLRASLVRVRPDDHVLVIVMHHVVTDGWSRAVIERELCALLAAFHRGQPSPLGELALQYADFATWQRGWLKGRVLDEQLAYWKDHLRGAPVSLDLPTDRPRPIVKGHRGASVTLAFAAETAQRVTEAARREGATPFILLLAAFDVLLSRHAGQEDVVVGVPIANRTRPELEGLVGFFVNTLAVRAHLDGAPTFREVVRRVRHAALAAYEHQDVPFERVVEELAPPRDPSRTPIFQVMFAHQHQDTDARTASFDGLDISREGDDLDVAKVDLTLFVEERGGELTGSLQYDSELFDRSTIERMARRFCVLLEAALRAPDTRIDRLPMMEAVERQTVVVDWNPPHDAPRSKLVHELVIDQALAQPRHAAIVCGGRTVTYEELHEGARALAAALRARGIGPGSLVALQLPRGIDLVVASLGVLMAGAAYLPIDPSYPADRIE
jgi:amino acid adenylation domain-containing protein